MFSEKAIKELQAKYKLALKDRHHMYIATWLDKYEHAIFMHRVDNISTPKEFENYYLGKFGYDYKPYHDWMIDLYQND